MVIKHEFNTHTHALAVVSSLIMLLSLNKTQLSYAYEAIGGFFGARPISLIYKVKKGKPCIVPCVTPDSIISKLNWASFNSLYCDR